MFTQVLHKGKWHDVVAVFYHFDGTTQLVVYRNEGELSKFTCVPVSETDRFM